MKPTRKPHYTDLYTRQKTQRAGCAASSTAGFSPCSTAPNFPPPAAGPSWTVARRGLATDCRQEEQGAGQ